MDGSDLTPRQQSVLAFLRDHQGREGLPPTVREICAHLGLTGPAGIHRVLGILQERGYITTAPGKKRSWRLTHDLPEKGLPVIGRIAAGLPIEAAENREEELPLNPTFFGNAACFALKVVGDSMIEAHIMDGDLAIIEPIDTAANGEIVAVLVDDLLTEATLKKIHRTREATELRAANEAYPPLIFTGEEQRGIRVIGRYVGIIRRP